MNWGSMKAQKRRRDLSKERRVLVTNWLQLNWGMTPDYWKDFGKTKSKLITVLKAFRCRRNNKSVGIYLIDEDPIVRKFAKELGVEDE